MASTQKVAPYGTWESPITTDIVSGSNLNFKEVHVCNNDIFVVESRPSEKGRCALVQLNLRSRSGEPDKFPKEYSIKSKIHEYGGGAGTMTHDGRFVFVDGYTDGVFKTEPHHGKTEEILRGDKKLRYADFDAHPINHELIVAIQEDHRGKEVINSLALINSQTKTTKVLVEGADFYSHPKFSHDGKMICWMQWNHPDMPWTGSEVYIADFEGGKVGKTTKVAGEAKKISIAQPKWHLDDTLLYGSDITGFWQLYRYDTKTREIERLEIEGYEEAELAGREFILGACSYVSMTKDLLVITYTRDAATGLVLYNVATKATSKLPTDLIDIQASSTAVRRVNDDEVVVISATRAALLGVHLIRISEPESEMFDRLLKSSTTVELPTNIFSPARTITFPRKYGDSIGTPSHAIFIPPHNPGFKAPKDSSPPPLIVWIHGGPTAHSSPGLSLKAQYYTSRGYAYCLVNYAGSTSYGRKYREQLDYNWGLKDCEDTVSCIEYLAEEGLINKDKVGITGSSAGGYTVLQGMVTFPKSFAAGCSLYGVGNLKSLAADTHKFESHYLFDLLFPSSAPDAEREKVYKDRSPCFHAKKIEAPLVMLQGDIDMVVPLAQAQEMEKILRELGRDVKLVVFEDEGHGFVRGENVKRAIEEEEGLWRRCLL